MNEPRTPSWHLEKSVSVGHIVSTAIFIAGGLFYVAGLEGRIGQADVERAHIKDSIKRIEAQQADQGQEIGRKLEEIRSEQKQDNRRIEEKIDRLIERELNGRK